MKKLYLLLTIFFTSLSAMAISPAPPTFDMEDPPHKVVIYPNPVNGEVVHVETQSLQAIEMINLVGKSVYRHKIADPEAGTYSISADRFQQGMYFMKLTFTDKKTIIQKIIIK